MKSLIQKYWQGGTSLEEEQQLRVWLKTAPSTTENRQLADLLNWYDQEAERKIPRPIQEPVKESSFSNKSMKVLMWVSGLAAAIALFFFFSQAPKASNSPLETQNLAYVDTYEDPEEAYQVAQNALMMMSKKMNATKKHKKKLKKIEILSDLVESFKKK